MSDETTATPTDGLWSRLRLIEGQPLADRADAYSTLHDELFRRLESGTKLDSAAREKSAEKTQSGDP
ncbi:hypothetical protein [Microbacterium sp. AK031]|uniref:hypothetical protein n=1 Tax=Microbacterium sp. AK031 TaxID=2723076 RepID=UPI002167BAB3|nr:hypothetical protein [Microbacterium sp. AK031]MCS3844064.1 hypothetical protein [Microbacterium sp. AK031]